MWSGFSPIDTQIWNQINQSLKRKRRKGLGGKRKKTRRDANLNELLLVAHTRKLGPGVSVKRSTKLNSDELI